MIRRRIPFVQQLELADCGAACLAMVLAHHGRPVPLAEIRLATGTGRDGVDGRALVQAAHFFGIQARGVRIQMEDLHGLPRGSILHWRFNHFVVFDGIRRTGVHLLDPGIGRRCVSKTSFRQSFTGVAIVFERAAAKTAKPLSNRPWRYVVDIARQPALLWRLLVTSLMIQLFALGVPIATGVLVDRIAVENDRGLLVILSLASLGMVTFYGLAHWLRARLLIGLKTRLDVLIGMGLVSHLVNLPFDFFLRRSTGDLMARVNSSSTIREILAASTLSTMLDGPLAACYLLLMLPLSPSMTLLVMGLAAMQIVVLAASRGPNRRLLVESLEAQAKQQSYLVQLMNGIESVKAAGAEHRAFERWSNLFVDELNLGIARGRLSATWDSLTDGMRIGAPLMVLTLGGFQVLAGRITLGTAISVSALATGFLVPVGGLATTVLQLQWLAGYMRRINDVLDTTAERAGTGAAPAPRLVGDIVVEKVAFRFSPHGVDVLHDVSMHIPDRATVAVVGPSGSGKSTLVGLLATLLTPASGSIRIGGYDLSEFDPRTVRRQFGILTQHPYLFAANIRDNIDLGCQTTMEDVEWASWVACIDEDVRAMAQGYETVLSDGGASISGGQRQRIALARALVHRPAVLILDEATSALDSVTEARIYARLQAVPCTKIIVAHRLSTIAHADRILVIENGTIVEEGTHDGLMARRRGYYRLVSRESAGSAVRVATEPRVGASIRAGRTCERSIE